MENNGKKPGKMIKKYTGMEKRIKRWKGRVVRIQFKGTGK
jgi:hypothetical protein